MIDYSTFACVCQEEGVGPEDAHDLWDTAVRTRMFDECGYDEGALRYALKMFLAVKAVQAYMTMEGLV